MPVGREARAVQRAVPGFLQIVEAHDPAEVGTDCGQGTRLAADGRDRDRLTSFGADSSGALGRRPFVILERVQLGFQPAFRGRRPDGSVFAQESDGARRLTDSSPQRPRPWRYASRISLVMRKAAAAALVIPHLLYPVAR